MAAWFERFMVVVCIMGWCTQMLSIENVYAGNANNPARTDQSEVLPDVQKESPSSAPSAVATTTPATTCAKLLVPDASPLSLSPPSLSDGPNAPRPATVDTSMPVRARAATYMEEGLSKSSEMDARRKANALASFIASGKDREAWDMVHSCASLHEDFSRTANGFCASALAGTVSILSVYSILFARDLVPPGPMFLGFLGGFAGGMIGGWNYVPRFFELYKKRWDLDAFFDQLRLRGFDVPNEKRYRMPWLKQLLSSNVTTKHLVTSEKLFTRELERLKKALQYLIDHLPPDSDERELFQDHLNHLPSTNTPLRVIAPQKYIEQAYPIYADLLLVIRSSFQMFGLGSRGFDLDSLINPQSFRVRQDGVTIFDSISMADPNDLLTQKVLTKAGIDILSSSFMEFVDRVRSKRGTVSLKIDNLDHELLPDKLRTIGRYTLTVILSVEVPGEGRKTASREMVWNSGKPDALAILNEGRFAPRLAKALEDMAQTDFQTPSTQTTESMDPATALRSGEEAPAVMAEPPMDSAPQRQRLRE